MTRSYSAGGSRQAAVLTAIIGFHFGMFLLIATGFGPRMIGVIRNADPLPVTLLPRQPEPVKESVPKRPGPIDIDVSVLPKPDLVIPQFRNAPDSDMSQDTGSTKPGEGADIASPSGERLAPRLKSRNGRLAALIDSCYPAGSRRAGEEGRAIVHMVIGSQGQVSSWRLAGSSGFPRLDAAVRCIIERLEFLPGRQDGQAIAAEVQLPIVFHLD
jgi:protein TonB